MAPEDPTPDDVDEPEADLLPDDPADGLEPDVPRAPDTAANDAPAELQKQFWSIVLLFNVALFALSLGAMLVWFDGRWQVGGALVAVGAFAFARGWRGYRDATGTDWNADETDTEDDGDATDLEDRSDATDADVRKD